tara:strand:- start:35 stop:244 length:210 start_codon:yes stop_codon:yes gene_type:complete
MNKENTLTRDQIQNKYIEWYIDSSNLEMLILDVKHMMANDLDMLDDVELVKEVKRYAPELIEGITLSIK